VLDRAVYLLSKKALFGEQSGEKLGKKLEERFRYFLSAFITLALSNGATLPLSIADDQHASLQTFIKHGGPKHIINMMKSHLDKNELMRASLALLIVVVNLLRNKLSNALIAMEDMHMRNADQVTDHLSNAYAFTSGSTKSVADLSRSNSIEGENGEENDDAGEGGGLGGASATVKEDESPTQAPKFVRSATLQAVAQRKIAAAGERRVLQSVIEWTTVALHAFSDGGRSATMCVTFLISTLVPSVQQLSLTLLALLVTVCSTSARRMLQPHSTAHEGTGTRSKREIGPDGKGDTAGSTFASKMNGTKEAINHDNPERGGRSRPVKRVTTPLELTLKNAFASTLSFPLIAKRLGVYCPQNDRLFSKRLRGLKNGNNHDATASCMSYIFTVAARENSPIAMAGCAEIVLAMTIEDECCHANNSTDLAHDSVSTNRGSYSYKAARTPTCALPAGDVSSGLPNASEGGKKTGVQPTPAQSAPQDDAVDKKILQEEWVGVKIFIRFLARNIRYFEQKSDNGCDLEEGATEQRPLRKKASTAVMDKEAELLGRGGISSQQLQGLVYAFHKAIAALSSLITMSTKVAAEVASMHGGDEVLRASVNGLGSLVSSDGTGMVSVADCKHLRSLAQNAALILREEKERQLIPGNEDYRRPLARQSTLDGADKRRNESRPKAAETFGSMDNEKDMPGAAGGAFGTAIISKSQRSKEFKRRPQTTDPTQQRPGRDQEYAIYMTGDGNVLAGPGQTFAAKNWTGDILKGPRTGGLSPVANDRPLSSQFGQKYRKDVSYSMPEHPTRRGLSPKHFSRDDDTSLHKVVFQNMSAPALPQRLETEGVNQIVNDLQHRDEFRGRKVLNAVRKLEEVSKSAEKILTMEGFTYNGQHSIPQLERARRIYLPTGQPISWEMQESGELGNNSTSFVLQDPSAKNTSYDTTDGVQNQDLILDSVANNQTSRAVAKTLMQASVPQEMATVSRLRDDGLRHKTFIESMIKVTQSVVTSSADILIEANMNQDRSYVAISTAANAISIGTDHVLSRPPSAGNPVKCAPISMAIGVVSQVISTGTEKVLSRPSSAAATDLPFRMHTDDFNFDIPDILEMAPIYAISLDSDQGKYENLTQSNDFHVNNDYDSAVHAENSSDDLSKRCAAEEEEVYKSVSKTSRNVEGLVTAATVSDREQAKGYGRVKKAPAVAFAESTAGRVGEHMELVFPK